MQRRKKYDENVQFSWKVDFCRGDEHGWNSIFVFQLWVQGLVRLAGACWWANEQKMGPFSLLNEWQMSNGVGEWHMPVLCLRKCFSGWWFQRLFIFTPTWGRFPTWRACFSKGLKPPTSSLSWRKTCFFSPLSFEHFAAGWIFHGLENHPQN